MSEEKRGRGRPKKPVADIRDDQVRIRITTETKKEWLQKANTSGYKSVTAWIRSLANAA